MQSQAFISLVSIGLGLSLGCDAATEAAAQAIADKAEAVAAEAKPDTKPESELPVDISPAKAPEDTWMAFSNENDKFSVRFPSAPKKDTMEIPNPLGIPMPVTSYTTGSDNEFMTVSIIDVPESLLGEFDVQGALDGGRDGMVNNVGGKILEERQIKFAGEDGRAIKAEAKSEGVHFALEARMFWKSPRVYQLLVVYEHGAANPPADRFFESFALTP